jgi:hypothetical protein
MDDAVLDVETGDLARGEVRTPMRARSVTPTLRN